MCLRGRNSVAEKPSSNAPTCATESAEADHANELGAIEANEPADCAPLAFSANDVSLSATASPAHVLLLSAHAHNISVNKQGPFRSMDQMIPREFRRRAIASRIAVVCSRDLDHRIFVNEICLRLGLNITTRTNALCPAVRT